jgi:CheY-like chemotaxis protein
MVNRPIIVIDDDGDDLSLIQDAFAALGVENEIVVFNDGFKFLDFIRETTKKPFFILCDINMSKIGGLELRKKIFDDERLRLKCIPFLFFSTSGAPPFIVEAYSYNVQGYFVKPPHFDTLKDMLDSMMKYWGYSEHPNSKG